MIMLDGEQVAAEDVAALAVTNYGHFTSLRVDDLKVKGLPLHLERLRRDSTELFGNALSEAELSQLIARAGPHLAGTHEPTMVRVSIFEPGDRTRVLVSTWTAPERGDPAGIRVQTRDFVRNLPHVKHVGLFGASHERKLAQNAGFDDALFVAPSGLVSEGPTWNLAGVLDGELVWPDDECLPGITRELRHGRAGHQRDRRGLAPGRPGRAAAAAGRLAAGGRGGPAGAGRRPVHALSRAVSRVQGPRPGRHWSRRAA